MVVACRADAKTKKQEKLISAAKTKAMKAVAKADELRKKLEAATKVADGKSQLVLTCGTHSNKKSKGAAGRSTPTSTTTTASYVDSPQQKPFSANKRVNTWYPFRYFAPVLLTGERSGSSSGSVLSNGSGSWGDTSGSSKGKSEEETAVVLPCPLGAPAQKQGGRRSRSPKPRVLRGTKAPVATYSLDKFYSDLHNGLGSEGESKDSDSHNNRGSSGGKESTALSACLYAATYQAVSQQFDQEEDNIIEGIFPGNDDHALVSQFVAHHFAGVWEEYAPFNS